MATAIAVNAATYNWETSLGDGYDGMTWYVVNGSGVSDLVALLATDGDTAGFTSAMSNYGSNVQSGTFEAGWDGWQDGLFANAADKAFVFVIDSLTEGATFFYSSELATTAYQYEPPSGSPGALVFDSVSSATIAASGDGGAPEPTSGLLLLIGASLLGLRRKQK